MTRAAAKPPPTGACAPLKPRGTTPGITQDHHFPPTAGAIKIPIEKDEEAEREGETKRGATPIVEGELGSQPCLLNTFFESLSRS